MTPLIDVVFLLLIFFLVASRLSQEDGELDVPLPTAANAMPMTAVPQELIVNIDRQGHLILDGKQTGLTSFEKQLKDSMVNNPLGFSVLIRADRNVPLQAPVDVMDICLKCGASYSLSIDNDAS
ncbi:MAG: biopolymer transporter ExbD [Planctomycetales bacterium]|nr:biopolymer transporter ExbD [Planctomycetales bacterium]